MQNRDEFHDLLGSLNHLALIKMAYDAGVPLNELSHYSVSYEFGEDHSWDNFIISVQYLFEIEDWYWPYDDTNQEEKKYWMSLVDDDDDISECKGVYVFMDDRIKPFESIPIGGYQPNGWYSGFGQLHSIDRGIVMIFDEEEGPIDYTETLAALIGVLKDSERKEDRPYEMAV